VQSSDCFLALGFVTLERLCWCKCAPGVPSISCPSLLEKGAGVLTYSLWDLEGETQRWLFFSFLTKCLTEVISGGKGSLWLLVASDFSLWWWRRHGRRNQSVEALSDQLFSRYQTRKWKKLDWKLQSPAAIGTLLLSVTPLPLVHPDDTITHSDTLYPSLSETLPPVVLLHLLMVPPSPKTVFPAGDQTLNQWDREGHFPVKVEPHARRNTKWWSWRQTSYLGRCVAPSALWETGSERSQTAGESQSKAWTYNPNFYLTGVIALVKVRLLSLWWKHYNQSILGRKWVFWLTLSHDSPSLKEVRAGTQTRLEPEGRGWCRGCGEVLPTALLPLACSACL
jgi:hypothetical protein